MSLDNILNDILVSSFKEKTAQTRDISKDQSVKIASHTLTSEDAAGLVKLSSLIREVNVEPTYKDLYTFVGGLYGR